MQKHAVIFRDLGQMDYQQAWDLQEKTLRANLDIKSKAMEQQVPAETVDHLFFVEHPAVYTLGKSGNKENVLLGEEELKEKQIQFFHTNRGGDITFHGAGQIVGYPILDLERYGTDIGKYLRNIEQVIINLLAEYGLKGDRSKGETGVWLDPDIPGRERKICAIGVRCSRWITMHGFALNVNTDLTYFEHIIPCGIVGKQVTSLQKELGHEINMEEVKDKLRLHFEQIFQVEFRSEILL
ncbi:MAG: lipoyl(octanoyl) transferase LipB [Chitinophagaceae bacterium]|nr:lipoyl(octanoyl) transferase LipB [Chitinophagaceae bacterium]